MLFTRILCLLLTTYNNVRKFYWSKTIAIKQWPLEPLTKMRMANVANVAFTHSPRSQRSQMNKQTNLRRLQVWQITKLGCFMYKKGIFRYKMT